ncbi:MAG: DHH family phosphoesterase, partial [Oscillospiraceae bacterium]|nr:DHH family phosphoesterase [Oscillospiraceae bacterium]
MTIKQWQLHSPDREAAALLAEQSGLPPFLALLLSARGLDADSAEAFLARDTLMDDAFAFAGMDAAVERIQRAIDTGESVAVFGDYDADGITATVLLYQYLKGRGAHVTYALPTRDGGGYGLHNETIDKLAEEGVRLLVTVDNGISAMEEAAHAAARGVDMVITDHHCPQGALPAAVAVIDPRRPDCGSVFKDYAGVGVAFKLVCALEGDEDAMLEQYADLVAVGTLADVCPLTGENRVLVRRGLQKLNEAPSPGLRALCAA